MGEFCGIKKRYVTLSPAVIPKPLRSARRFSNGPAWPKPLVVESVKSATTASSSPKMEDVSTVVYAPPFMPT